MRTRSLFLPTLAVVVLAAVAACTSTAASPSVAVPTVAAPTVAPTVAPPTQAASQAPSQSSPASGAATVMVADSSLGKILVDGEGRTLYLFTPDEAGTPTCYDDCATAWPPLLATGDITVGTGLDDSDFSTASRTDGGDQVKVGNWPLYYFATDAAPGDTKGQGLFGRWYVVSPAGAAIK
jgi:predicted lipoprotein with Yx(FWY)xxD motif